MSRQVKTPRFYVDIPSFLHATGRKWGRPKDSGGAELLYMNPSNPFIRELESVAMFRIGEPYADIGELTSFPINFVALLNHNLASDDNSFMVQGTRQLFEENDHQGYDWETLTNRNHYDYTNILNGETASNPTIKPSWNGTTIFEIEESTDLWSSFFVKFNAGFDATINHQLGSLVVGKYWDAPNSPDLSLTMSRSFDGIKKQKTIGGKTLPYINYDGPTQWTMNHPDDGTYKYPPFELGLPTGLDGTDTEFNQRAKSGLGRKGLRSWKLTFSYISDDDMWMAYENSSLAPFNMHNQNFSTVTDTDVPRDNGNTVADFEKPNPMLSDDSFNFVWNVTLGGTLPFIFQPDNSDTGTNPDRFSICTFRDKSLNVKQVAFNTYTLSITIDEVG